MSYKKKEGFFFCFFANVLQHAGHYGLVTTVLPGENRLSAQTWGNMYGASRWSAQLCSRVHRRKMFIHIFFGYNIKCCSQHFMVGKGEVGEMEACCTDF